MNKLPLDIENLIYSFLPHTCDWCNQKCNYEIIDYVKTDLGKELLDPLEYRRANRRSNILALFALKGNIVFRVNAYICRLCKLSKFNFDNKYMWSRDYRTSADGDIIALYPRIHLRSYQYKLYGERIHEPIMMMTDHKWNIGNHDINMSSMISDDRNDEMEEID